MNKEERQEFLTVLGFLHAGDRNIPRKYMEEKLLPWIFEEVEKEQKNAKEVRNVKDIQNLGECTSLISDRWEWDSNAILESSKKRDSVGIENQYTEEEFPLYFNTIEALTELMQVKSKVYKEMIEKYSDFSKFANPGSRYDEFVSTHQQNIEALNDITLGLQKDSNKVSGKAKLKDESKEGNTVDRMLDLFQGSKHDRPSSKISDYFNSEHTGPDRNK